MSLLREIQNTLVEPNCDLPSLLRKCKILAYRLGSDEFKNWIEMELNGYPKNSDLPKYRIISVMSKGYFSGSFGAVINNAPIPLVCIPEEYRNCFTHSYIKQSVAGLINLINSNHNGIFKEPWDSDAVAIFGRGIYQGMNCLSAEKIIPANCIAGILDQVKTCVLNFVLEIEQQGFDIEGFNVDKSELEKVTQIFNTTINGSVQNLAAGSHDFKQIVNDSELFDNLIKTAKNIESKDVSEEFIKHIENMKNANTKDGFKSHYNDFMASLANHATVAGLFLQFLPSLSNLF